MTAIRIEYGPGRLTAILVAPADYCEEQWNLATDKLVRDGYSPMAGEDWDQPDVIAGDTEYHIWMHHSLMETPLVAENLPAVTPA